MDRTVADAPPSDREILDAPPPDGGMTDATADVVTCTSARMCPGQVCDMAAGRCVDCVANNDCTGGMVCRSNRCVAPPPPCTSSRECSARMQVCDMAASVCVDCVVDTDCLTGQRCTSDHACVVSACRSGAQECGSTGQLRTCSATGMWVETSCGANMACVGTACRAAVCTPGTYTCTSVASAGLCNPDGQALTAAMCPARAHGTPSCVANRCSVTCEAGWGNCDGDVANGCETDLNASAMNCGACGSNCPASPCVMGRCGPAACAAGTGDCDGNAANGCESMLMIDVSNCGVCGHACPAGGAGSSPECRSGMCATVCPSTLADCDGNAANGCETSVLEDVRNCGACGRTCAPGQECGALRCSFGSPGNMGTPRYDFGFAASSDGAAYAVGGYTTGRAITPSVEAYDLATRRWTARAPLPIARAALASNMLRDGRVLAIGGVIGETPTSVTVAYTPSKNSWSTLAPMPTARAYPTATRGNDGRIYVFGGLTQLVLFTTTNVTEVYDPASNSWATVRPMPRARHTASAVTMPDGRIYVFGGQDGVIPVSTIDVYDPVSDAWTAGPMSGYMGSYNTVRGSDERIYIIRGGTICTALTLPSTFTTLASLRGSRRQFGMVAFDGAIMVFGGLDGSSTPLVSGEMYTIALNSWVESRP